jgi:S-formylglutathione hydrolase FrmB
MQVSSTSILATSGATAKRCQQDIKKLRSKNKLAVTTKMTTNQTTVMSSSRTGTATRKTMMTTLTDTTAPYRQENDGAVDDDGEQYTGRRHWDASHELLSPHTLGYEFTRRL